MRHDALSTPGRSVDPGLRTDQIEGALPAAVPPLVLRQPVRLSDTLFVAGDHRDTPSQQGALASGARAARAIIRQLGAAG